MRRAALPPGRHPFNVVRNKTGGEDDLLFGAMKDQGARFAWSVQAWVWEDPAPDRLTLTYTLKRAYAYGQGPTATDAASRRFLGVARWMIVGLGQTAVFGLLAAIKFLLRAPDRAYAVDRMARGFGKFLWFPPFKFRFYGQVAPPA